MRRNLRLAFVIAAQISRTLAAQTVQQVIAKNIEARGGMAKIKSVQTIRHTGQVAMGLRLQAPAVILQKRPNRLRREITLQGFTTVEAYDGQSGWIMRSKMPPRRLSIGDARQLREQSDIDGCLVDYKRKGYRVDLQGQKKVGGADAYKLKVTLKDGDVINVFLDSKNFLEIREEQKLTIRGNDAEFDTSLGDYRNVNGLMLPFEIEVSQKGSSQKQKITIEKIELNVPVNETAFKMPQSPS